MPKMIVFPWEGSNRELDINRVPPAVIQVPMMEALFSPSRREVTTNPIPNRKNNPVITERMNVGVIIIILYPGNFVPDQESYCYRGAD
jgi:hypothetical protein